MYTYTAYLKRFYERNAHTHTHTEGEIETHIFMYTRARHTIHRFDWTSKCSLFVHTYHIMPLCLCTLLLLLSSHTNTFHRFNDRELCTRGSLCTLKILIMWKCTRFSSQTWKHMLSSQISICLVHAHTHTHTHMPVPNVFAFLLSLLHLWIMWPGLQHFDYW